MGVIHVCKCNHHGFEHRNGEGRCYAIRYVRSVKDKGATIREVPCGCDEFKADKTLAEYMAEANAA